jgi:outer membrane lipoprotein
MRRLFLLTVMTVCLAGCAPVISEQSLSLVDRGVSFAELRRDPDRYKGKHVLLGGGIAGVRNTNEGGELELVQFATGEKGKITETARTGGRFIARSKEFLDPVVFRAGLLVTLVGEVVGKKSMPLGEVGYTYPVVEMREIHVWKPGELPGPPTFHFDIGIGAIIR